MPVINPTPSVPTPSAPGSAPCGWTIDTTCCPDWDTYSNTVRDRAQQWATYMLWVLTGRRFGTCQVTVRPCGTDCAFYGGWIAYPVTADGLGTQWGPYVRGGQWFNCGCAGSCSCRPECSVLLPGPVASVVEVLVDGVVIDPALYRVDNRGVLIGMGGQCWPKCQNMNLAGDVEGTFEVTYLRGTPLPLAGAIAAGELACEFAKACVGAACGLPQNVQSITRQGIEVQMIDPSQLMSSGMTGIHNVDLFIKAVNPNGLRSRPRVWSPDYTAPAVRTS
jgi:hypothetical protein